MQINPVGSASINAVAAESKAESSKSGFSELLHDFLADANTQLQQAQKAEALLKDGTIQNMESLVYEIEKSDIALKLVTEIRNKALESYQDIMRMQV